MSGAKATAKDTREYLCGVRDKLKKLDKCSAWAFAYISNYPRSPFELPIEVSHHAHGDARPINMPDNISATRFKLIVADTRYNKPRLEQTLSSVELVPHASLSPTAQLPMMNAGPFAALMNLCMHGMQHGGTQNTGGQFKAASPCNLRTSGTKGLISLPLAEHHRQPRSSIKNTLMMAMTWRS